MNRHSSNLARLLPWATLLATLAGPAVPESVLGAEALEPDSVMRAVRRVHVHRVWSAPGMESDPAAGMSLYGHAEALGLRWRSLLIEVRLRTLEGKPVRVAAGTPPGYADPNGLFSMSTYAPVFDDRFEWKELRASFPYQQVLDLPPARPQQLIATFRVSCGGLSSTSEAEIAVPPAKAPAVKRAVRLLAIDPFSNTAAPKSASDPAEPPTEAGRHALPRGQHGLTLEAYVAAVGLDRSKMIGQLAIRGEDGRPLICTDPKTGAQKPFRQRVESDVVSDQAQILLHFVSYRALGLEPGPHRLILSYSATCEGFRATMEEEHVLDVTAARHHASPSAHAKDRAPAER